ncbi:hypothetical protein [Streptomyces sp. TRM70350]|uniref:hypothetical protein n=1 Tax=Streptomyces sp. TRM70350 TaxID=2856165 RepID=UPI001C46FDCF|nr:hypothetical protein [Streptomyces sp. TRM70350]MBV7697322.1 hypothetical protein [Streptomyces sp. TRM70350]
MSVEFNHTIVLTRDRGKSARFLAHILGLGALARLVAAEVPVQADPHGRQPRRINRDDGGRGVYFLDPAGHGLEVITRPYGSDWDSPLNGVTEEVPGAAGG